MHTNISWYCRTLIVTYYQLLRNDPPSVVTRSSRFLSRLAFMHRDCKTNHYLVSLKKSILKGYIHTTGVKPSPCKTIIVNETKNIYRELNSSTEAIGLLTDEIDIFLDYRANPIPKLMPTGSNRYSVVVFP